MAHGVGELDLNAPAVPPRNEFVNDECPYLLLDVRDRDEFDQCHIISGKLVCTWYSMFAIERSSCRVRSQIVKV